MPRLPCLDLAQVVDFPTYTPSQATRAMLSMDILLTVLHRTRHTLARMAKVSAPMVAFSTMQEEATPM